MAKRNYWKRGDKVYDDDNSVKTEKRQSRSHKRMNGWADLREFFRGRSK